MNLPYDMGNAGDLVKHGLIAEFTQWWCEHESRSLRFLDPFAGRPWASPPNPEVSRRLQALPASALRTAQPDPSNRYYGSAFVVFNTARASDCTAEVLVSDSEKAARDAFTGAGFKSLIHNGFSESDGFTILDTHCAGDLLLLDPFGDFLPRRAAEIIPKVEVFSARLACILFVLNLDPNNRVGERYAALRAKHLSTSWSLRCPKLPSRGVRGESKYEVEVLLTWQHLASHPSSGDLQRRLEALASDLGGVLDTNILFSAA